MPSTRSRWVAPYQTLAALSLIWDGGCGVVKVTVGFGKQTESRCK